MVSDEGSGYWIGVAAVAAALRALARAGSSRLLEPLMAALHTGSMDELIERANASPSPDFASLFPIVVAAAADGDAAAAEVLERAGRELAKIVEDVIARLFQTRENVGVAAYGGVFRNSMQVMESFREQLTNRVPQAKLIGPIIDPALGALNRARRNFARLARQSC